MADQNLDEKRRRVIAGQRLSGLLTAPPDSLDSFRAKRLGVGAAVEVDQLEDLRAILLFLGRILEDGHPSQWAHVRRIREMLVPRADLHETTPVRSRAPQSHTMTSPGVPRPARYGGAVAYWGDEAVPHDDQPKQGFFSILQEETVVQPYDPGATPQETSMTFDRNSHTQAVALRHGSPALPFRSPAQPPLSLSLATLAHTTATPSGMSVTGYAAFCAAVGVFPERAEELSRHYGIESPAARQSLDASWYAAFDAEPRLHLYWSTLYATLYDLMVRTQEPA
ncbi:MAG: hypothetical protein AAGA56_10490 [Myxococcota bacterium]